MMMMRRVAFVLLALGGGGLLLQARAQSTSSCDSDGETCGDYVRHRDPVSGECVTSLHVDSTPLTVLECLAAFPERTVTCTRTDQRVQLSLSEYRTMDGSGTLPGNRSSVGTPGTLFRRTQHTHGYRGDGTAGNIKNNLPEPRVVSNTVLSAHKGSTSRLLSQMHTYFGMLMVTDTCSTYIPRGPPQVPRSHADLEFSIPTCDLYFDADCVGNKTMAFGRAFLTPDENGIPAPRNDKSHYFDLEQIYGTNNTHPGAGLRHVNGTTMRCELLGNDAASAPRFFPLVGEPGPYTPAGDSRINKTPQVNALAVTFILEHNRLCGELRREYVDCSDIDCSAACAPRVLADRCAVCEASQRSRDESGWTEERLFQEARRANIAVYQKLVSREYLAALTGFPLDPYAGWDESADPRIDVFFAGATFRYGHAETTSDVPHVDADGAQSRDFSIQVVRDVAWSPERAGLVDAAGNVEPNGYESLLRGMAYTLQGKVGPSMVSDLRQMTWPHNSVGVPQTDLAATNIMRSRDLGLPAYVDARQALDGTVITSFSDLTSDAALIARLEAAYGRVGKLDAWVGGLVEAPAKPDIASLGPLFAASVTEQLRSSRDGDRLWFENTADGHFSEAERDVALGQNLNRLIGRNYAAVELTGNFPANPFWVPQRQLGSGNGLFTTLDSSWETRDLSSSYRLSWRLPKIFTDQDQLVGQNDGTIEFTLQVVNQGWVGIGFDPEPNTMKGADIYMIGADVNTTTNELEWWMRDSHARDVGEPSADVAFGGTADVAEWSATQENGVTRVWFKRALVTGDELDKPIEDREMRVIFAYHPSSLAPTYHGPTRSSTTLINFLDNSTSFVEVDHVSDGVLIVMAVLLALSLLLSVACFVFVMLKQTHWAIRNATPLFCAALCVGAFVMQCSVITAFVSDSDAACAINFWLLALGYAVLFGSLFIKNWRIHKIFNDPNAVQSSSQILSTGFLVKLDAGFVLLVAIYMAIWTGVDRPEARLVFTQGSSTEVMWACRDYSLGWLHALLAFFALTLAAGAVLSFLTRKVAKAYNESRPIANALYLCVFILAACWPMGMALRNYPSIEVLVQSIAVICSTDVVLVLLFYPKASAVVRDKEEQSGRAGTVVTRTGTAGASTRSTASVGSDSASRS